VCTLGDNPSADAVADGEELGALSYKLTIILFGLGVTLHNLEEAIFLVSWYRAHWRGKFRPNARIYWVLTSLVSGAIWIPILAVGVWPKSAQWQWALSGFALVIAVNAVFPHLAMSVATHSYMPGTATGILLNLPLGAWLIHEQLRAHVLTNIWRQAVPYAVLSAAAAFGSLFAAHAIWAKKGQS
jgi:hypothetical protein